MLHSADTFRTEAPEALSVSDIAALVENLGAPPAAPCAMPKQQLEPTPSGLFTVLRIFGVRAPRPEH